MWFYAALGMAFLSGITTVLSKHTLKTIDPITFYWSSILASTPILVIFAWGKGIPSWDFIFAVSIISSVVFYTISKIIFYKVIKNSLLSHVYPLIVIGPFFTLFFSMIILAERPSVMEFLGMGITLIGIYVLNISAAHESILEPFKILYKNKLAFFVLVSVFIASTVAITDKIAVNHTYPQNIFFVPLIQNILIILILLPWIILKRKKSFPEISANIKLLIPLGITGAIGYVLAFIAIQDGDPGLVTSVFRTQVFFTLFFSLIFFKDKPKKETILGTLIMIVGLIVLKLGS